MEENKNSLTPDQKAIVKVMCILQILKEAKKSPDNFPIKQDCIIWDEYFKCKAISKQEIIEWQNHSQGWNKMSDEEFEKYIDVCVPFINKSTESNGKVYYSLSSTL